MKMYVIKAIDPLTNQTWYVWQWKMEINKASDVRLSIDLNDAMLFDNKPADPNSAFPYIKEEIEKAYRFTNIEPVYVERTTTIVED